MAILEFLAAAARAWIVWLCFGHGLPQVVQLLHAQNVHNLIRIAAAAQQISHDAHGAIDVIEKLLVSGAQVVQPGLAIRRLDEAIRGTAAVAGKAHLAFPAVARQVSCLSWPNLRC